MKTKLAILAMSLCLAGCNKNIDTPEVIAEKYLSELSSDLSELGFYNARKHNSRSAVLIYNEQADSIINGGQIPTYSELSKKYFQDDRYFYRWEYLDISTDTVNIYRVWDFTNMPEEERKTRLELLGKDSYWKPVKITDIAAVIIEYENVPKYTIRYKIDKTHIDFVGDKFKEAKVEVIKHPDKGYNVVSFTWNE